MTKLSTMRFQTFWSKPILIPANVMQIHCITPNMSNLNEKLLGIFRLK